MRNKFLITLSFLIHFFTAGECQPGCKVEGRWIVKRGRLTKNYERTNSFSYNSITFSADSVDLASGFFYNILDLDTDDYALGRYPFVYYGNKEKYKVNGDSLYVYSNPYKRWETFRMYCDDGLRLIGKSDTLLLLRNTYMQTEQDYSIKSIKAHVYELGLGLYDVDYTVSYSKDDVVLFEQSRKNGSNFHSQTIKLKTGTFEGICKRLGKVKLFELDRIYPSKISEKTIVKLEIIFESGKIINFQLENDSYPDELRLALIPVLYGHQKFLYSDLPAIKFN